MKMLAKEQIKEASFSVKVIRANGTVEDLGVVSYYSSNPLKMIWWKIKQNLFKT